MPRERIQHRIESLLDQADAAIEAGEWERAEQRAQNALALDPDNEDARSFLEAAERRPGAEASTSVAPPTAPTPQPEGVGAAPTTRCTKLRWMKTKESGI